MHKDYIGFYKELIMKPEIQNEAKFIHEEFEKYCMPEVDYFDETDGPEYKDRLITYDAFQGDNGIVSVEINMNKQVVVYSAIIDSKNARGLYVIPGTLDERQKLKDAIELIF